MWKKNQSAFSRGCHPATLTKIKGISETADMRFSQMTLEFTQNYERRKHRELQFCWQKHFIDERDQRRMARLTEKLL